MITSQPASGQTNELMFSDDMEAKIKFYNNSVINKVICVINTKLANQLDIIFTNTVLVNLISNWYGLSYLVRKRNNNSVIKILNLSLSEAINKLDYDQVLDSMLGHKVVAENETPGNHPISLIIGVYELDISKHSIIKWLSSMASFCQQTLIPFVSSVNLSIVKLELILKDDYCLQSFRDLRQDPNSDFIVLLLNKISLTNNCIQKKKIYSNGVFALAATVKAIFDNTGWFFDLDKNSDTYTFN